jgi:hypothetical protein
LGHIFIFFEKNQELKRFLKAYIRNEFDSSPKKNKIAQH